MAAVAGMAAAAGTWESWGAGRGWLAQVEGGGTGAASCRVWRQACTGRGGRGQRGQPVAAASRSLASADGSETACGLGTLVGVRMCR